MRPTSMPRLAARRTRAGLTWIALAAAALAAPASARAHFLWLAAGHEEGKPTVRAFLSETPVPDSPELLKHIAASKITAGAKVLSWAKDDDTFKVELPESGAPVVDGFCDLGLMSRQGTTFRLLYTARAQFGPATAPEPEGAEHLRVRFVADGGRAPAVAVTLNGKPVAGAVVKVFPDEGDPVEKPTDDRGRVDVAGVAEGKTGLLAKWSEKKPGEHQGKPYGEVRYYATLTVAPAADPKQAAAAPATAPFALLPEAINSFGGAVSGGWLYVYSGHVGETHKYHRDTTTPHFRRLNLADRSTWEELPAGPALQGVTLMAHGGKLYRIGGMSAHNAPGTPDDLRSVADFACFDPETKTWTALTPLPGPRSTHDAVVVGDKIYVVGGWNMTGGGSAGAEFCDDALAFDLARPEVGWGRLPEPPFRRRALAAGACGGKVYVLGGLTEGGSVTKAVDVYDPATRSWSKGPELPGSKLEGFAPSAFAVGGRLYLSGHDGALRRLNSAGDGWEDAGKLAVPRLTHRLLPGMAGDLLAVGGTFANAPVRFVESLSAAGSAAGPKVVAWTIPVPGPARKGQAVGLVRSKLVAVGGNRTAEPHTFAAENLVRDGVRVTLGSMRTEPIAPLPEPRQSATLLVAREGRKPEVFLLGGIGPDGDVSRTLGDVLRLDPESGDWTKSAATIPDARGMFGAATYKDAVWIFGGSAWDPRPGKAPRTMTTDVLRWEFGSAGATLEPTGQKIPHARRSFAGTALGSKYYLVGGLGGDMKLVEPVDVFDFDAGTWGTIPAPAQPRLFADLAALDGKLYLAGGFTRPEGGHFEPAETIEVFDPAANAWATLPVPVPVATSDLRMIPIQGRLLLYSADPDGSGQARFALVAP